MVRAFARNQPVAKLRPTTNPFYRRVLLQSTTQWSFASSNNFEHHQSIFSKGCCCKNPPNARSRAATIASITGLCPILRSQPAEHHEHHWSVLLPHGSDTELFTRTRYPTPCTSGGVCLAGTPTSQNWHYCVLGVRVQERANGHQCQVHQRGVVFIGFVGTDQIQQPPASGMVFPNSQEAASCSSERCGFARNTKSLMKSITSIIRMCFRTANTTRAS